MFKWVKKVIGNEESENNEKESKIETPEIQDEVIELDELEKAEDKIDEAILTQKEEKTQTETLIVDEEQTEETGFFKKLIKGLTKTRNNISEKIDSVLFSFKKIDEELFEQLEEILITSDVGIETTMKLMDNLKNRIKDERVEDPAEIKLLLKDEILKIMNAAVDSNELNIEPHPAIMLIVGVNGVGKTTTIGKLASRLRNENRKVLIAAGDTFRAAAIEQLEEWGNRAKVDVISHSEGSDSAAVVYDGIQAAKARKVDVLICDTAGRLHNKSNLMNELSKIFRVIEREYPEASKEILLVLDATTGQNAMIQAKTFKEVANITGIALTKLDGTAKGGMVIALESELNVPVKLVGVGEGLDDLQPFDNKSFIDAIFS